MRQDCNTGKGNNQSEYSNALYFAVIDPFTWARNYERVFYMMFLYVAWIYNSDT
jgi:hypothetical protein